MSHHVTAARATVSVITHKLAAFFGNDPEELKHKRAGISYRRDATVAFVRHEGFEVSGGDVLEVFRVTAKEFLAGPSKGRWSATLRKWSANSQTWAVEKVSEREYVVRRHWTLAEVRKAAQAHLEDVEGVEFPLTIADPVAPRCDLTDDAVRLAVRKVLPRVHGAVPVDALADLLAALPGWSIEPAVFATDAIWNGAVEHLLKRRLAGGFRQDGGWFSLAYPLLLLAVGPDGNARDATEGDVDAVRRVVAVVDACPETGAPVNVPHLTWLATEVSLEVDPRHHGDALRRVKLCGARIALRGWRVTAPDGETRSFMAARMSATDDAAENMAYDDGFWPWAYARGLARLADGVIASLDPNAVQLASRDVDYTNTGKCQLCMRIQKLHVEGDRGARVMVEHGFCHPQSEGWRGGLRGERVDSCEGTDELPYEKSCDLLRRKLDELRSGLAEARERGARLLAIRDAKEAVVEVPREWVERRAQDATPARLEPSHPRWLACVERLLAMHASALAEMETRERVYAMRVANWSERPLFDETRAGAKP